MSDVPILSLEGVTRTFPGVVALDGVSLALRAGRVHALLGENGAGKSTLIAILSGILAPDAGQLLLGGKPLTLNDPEHARRLGIVTVYQEGDFFPDLTVAENVGLEFGWTSRFGVVDRAALRTRAADCLRQFGSEVSPDAPAATLTAGQRQVVAVAAALSCDAAVLILDEPTSSLSRAETHILFDRVRRFRDRGGAVLYVSHRLEEVFALADEATVLRDGRKVWGGPLTDTDPGRLIAHMVGRDAPAVSARAAVAPGPVRLACRGITDSESAFQDVTLGVRAGEVLGLYGLVGAGRSEWAQGLLGLRQIESGEILLDGKPWAPAGPAAAARRGLVYLPEDRLRLGLFPGLSVIANAVVAVLRRISLGPFARPAEEMRVAGDVVRSLAVRLRSLGQPAATLSGGNQQKVILGRWLACDPSVLLLDEPTRGVDVGAKDEIHAALRRLAASGRAIVLISSDLTEVLAYSDRVGVFCEGRLTAEFDPRGATAEEVARAALPVGKADRESSSSPAPGSRATAWLSARSRDAAPLFAAVLLAAILSWRTDTFLQPATLIDIASSASLLTLCGLGAALVIVAGGIDISFGAVMALSAAAAGVLMREGWPPGLAALTALLVGAAAGATNAALTLAARVHPIVITLGTVSLYRGLTIRLVGARAIDDVPDAFRAPWLAAPLGVPAGVWLAGAAVACAWWVLGNTVAGRSVVALGSNPRAAERVGISQSRTWLVVFALQGLLAALAGLQAMAATAHLQARDFEETTLEAIGVAVVGGIAITGGRGSVWGVVAAALLFRVLDKGWVLLHVPAFWQRTVVGGMLLLAILGDRLWRLVGGAQPQAAKSGGIRA